MELIAVESVRGLNFSISVRSHQLNSDMGLNEGGQDEGASPTELLVASLGTCIGISLARYCKTIGVDSQGLALYMTYQLAENPKRISSIVVDLELPESFPKDRVAAARRVMAACPVHNTLENPPEIDIEIS